MVIAGFLSVPLIAPLVLLLASVRRGPGAVLPTEAHVWRCFRRLFLDESQRDRSWRWRAECRADNIKKLVTALALDLDRFGALSTVATPSTRWAQEVGAALLGPSGPALPNPAQRLRLQVARKALDAWVLGEWKRLPGIEVDPAVFVGRGERSIMWKKAWTVVIPVLVTTGVVIVALKLTGVFPGDGATAIIGPVTVLVVGVLVPPIGEMLKRWGRLYEDAASRRRTPPAGT